MGKEIKINAKKFMDEHLHGLLYDNTHELGDFLMEEVTKGILNGTEDEAITLISQEELDLVLANDKDYEILLAEEKEVNTLRLKGMEEDKKGNTESAVEYYEKCIFSGENATHILIGLYAHAYARIIVDLNKLKEYEKERMYIEKYLQYNISNVEREKLVKRLTLLQNKMNAK